MTKTPPNAAGSSLYASFYSLVVFVPSEALESLKTALFAQGAGRMGNYDQCAWQVQGQGQFRPLPGSVPVRGAQDLLHQLAEYRLECVVAHDCVAAVVHALLAHHPYETPAYWLTPVFDAQAFGIRARE